jgi:hypothetical protein
MNKIYTSRLIGGCLWLCLFVLSCNLRGTSRSWPPEDDVSWSPSQNLLFRFESVRPTTENRATRVLVYSYNHEKFEFVITINTVVPFEVGSCYPFLTNKNRLLILVTPNIEQAITIIDLDSKKCVKQYGLSQILHDRDQYRFGGVSSGNWMRGANLSGSKIVVKGGFLCDVVSGQENGLVGPNFEIDINDLSVMQRPADVVN